MPLYTHGDVYTEAETETETETEAETGVRQGWRCRRGVVQDAILVHTGSDFRRQNEVRTTRNC